MDGWEAHTTNEQLHGDGDGMRTCRGRVIRRTGSDAGDCFRGWLGGDLGTRGVRASFAGCTAACCMRITTKPDELVQMCASLVGEVPDAYCMS